MSLYKDIRIILDEGREPHWSLGDVHFKVSFKGCACPPIKYHNTLIIKKRSKTHRSKAKVTFCDNAQRYPVYQLLMSSCPTPFYRKLITANDHLVSENKFMMGQKRVLFLLAPNATHGCPLPTVWMPPQWSC